MAAATMMTMQRARTARLAVSCEAPSKARVSPSRNLRQSKKSGKSLPSVKPLGQPSERSNRFTCSAKTDTKEVGLDIDSLPTDEMMANVGLDDVFRLVDDADEFIKEEPKRVSSTLSKEKTWYNLYWRTYARPETAFTKYYGPKRPRVFGPWGDFNNRRLDGSLPGDYGWDSLGLASDVYKLARYRELELINGRWAMLGVTGALVPDILSRFGFNFGDAATWFKAGGAVFKQGGVQYLANPGLIAASNIYAILAIQIALMGAVEVFRVNGGPLGEVTADMEKRIYPGDKFDPLGFSNDYDNFAELKVKEIKNARLAMVAMAGLIVQALVTRDSPIDNLLAHVQEPGVFNFFLYIEALFG